MTTKTKPDLLEAAKGILAEMKLKDDDGGRRMEAIGILREAVLREEERRNTEPRWRNLVRIAYDLELFLMHDPSVTREHFRVRHGFDPAIADQWRDILKKALEKGENNV